MSKSIFFYRSFNSTFFMVDFRFKSIIKIRMIGITTSVSKFIGQPLYIFKVILLFFRSAFAPYVILAYFLGDYVDKY